MGAIPEGELEDVTFDDVKSAVAPTPASLHEEQLEIGSSLYPDSLERLSESEHISLVDWRNIQESAFRVLVKIVMLKLLS